MNPHLRMYRQQQVQHEVQQASPVQLVVMLYDRAISLSRQSLLHMEKGQVKEKGMALNQVIEILSELQRALNLEEGGTIAQRLDDLYTFLLQQVTVANLRNDPQPISTVLNVLEELREGWRGVQKMVQDGAVAEAGTKQG
ncbi:MAG: flagellar export chaperone FliS [Nitrospinae bacterium]|nr:flagellar export chaperone FliS [Nitrospinota bacterium]